MQPSERYSNIRYKVHLADKPLDKAFPDLFRHKEFQVLIARPDFEKLIRYIMYLYDKNTLLIQEYQSDLNERKAEAAKDAGYKKINGKWTKDIQDVMDIQDHEATAAIMQLLKMQKNNIWTEIIITEQELFEYQSIRFTPVSKKKGKKGSALDEKMIIESTVKKEALLKACNQRISILEGLYAQFFGDNTELIQSEYDEPVRPEIAERLFVDKPYEEDKSMNRVLSN